MEYMKLQRSFRKSDAWVGADAAARGAWVSVAGYCADEENGGRIVAAKRWLERLWQHRVGCTLPEIEHAIALELARWDGDDLIVEGYDLRGEQAYQDKRSQARTGGERSGEVRRERMRPPSKAPDVKAPAQADGEAEAKRTLQPMSEAHASSARSSEPEAKAEPIYHVPVSTGHDQVTAAAARARAPEDARLAAAVALGAELVDPGDGRDLTPRWLAVLAELTVEQVRKAFAAAPRILGHELRYPGKLPELVTALTAEARLERSAARAAAKRAEERAETERSRVILAAVDWWLASEAGAKVAAAIASRPPQRQALRDLHDFTWNPTQFLELTRAYPDLARVAALALEQPEPAEA